MNKDIMHKVLDLANQSVELGGGPFAAAIVRDGEVIALEHNSVHIHNDPSAHAEVNAIRKACSQLETIDLSNCEIYSSCEPCPMCFGAIYWSHLKKVYFAANKTDAAEAGFDDDFIYKEINMDADQRSIPFIEMDIEGKTQSFETWNNSDLKKEY